jgi:putative peptidoglycan lipid II flippase
MNLFKSFATISGFTLLSRITGLLREILVARAFGASGLTDAFNIAFRLPNLLRRLFAEGAFSQAFVPILSEYHQKEGREGTFNLIQMVTVVMFWALLVVIILGVLGAGVLVSLIASGFASKGILFDQARLMTQIMFPYIGFMSFVAMASGILNVYAKFAIPAFTPILLNLSFIGVAFFFPQNIMALAWAVILGGALQLLIQIPALKKIGMLPSLSFRHLFNLRAALSNKGVKKVLKQMLPAILAVSVAQISLIINTNIASHLTEGSVSWLSYADRLMEFPTALLGVALSTILMPTLSKAVHSNNPERYSELLDWGLKLVLILSVPAALTLWFYGKALAAGLFHYGKFDNHDVMMTYQALRCYGIGLIGLISVKILAPGFYAKQDIKTPVKIGLFILLFTQVLNYFLVPELQHAALALSIGLGACMNAFLLLIGLRYKGLYKTQTKWFLFMFKVSIAAILSAFMMHYFAQQIDWLGLKSQPVLRMFYLIGTLSVIALVYLATLYVLKVPLRALLKKKI